MMQKYLKIWMLLSLQSSKIAFTSRFGVFLFVLGKLIRFFLFLLFIVTIASRVEYIAGYTLWQMIFFFATFNVIDSATQLFFREVYRFRTYVVSGEFDHILTKPMSPLFRCLFGGTDILDVPLLLLTSFLLLFAIAHLEIAVSFFHAGVYILLLLNAFLIAAAFHVFVLAVGILTTEVDNTLWLYRDITQMGRVPVEIYQEPLRGFITFIIPVGIMMTFPAQALMGFLAPQVVFVAFLLGIVFLVGSFSFWRFALKRYTSASS